MNPRQRTFEDLARIRRSVAMLEPGVLALRREDARQLLAELQRTEAELRRLRRGLRELLEGA